MELKLLQWVVVWSAVSIWLMVPLKVNSDPIAIDFNLCKPATFPSNPVIPDAPLITEQCCPILPTKPIIDGPPPPSTSSLRVRQASQCTDASYAAKINKAYELMKALPDDDPRSFTRQWNIHCAYCGQSFLQSNSSGIEEGIDIHYSWLFLPWHRWYLFFHERILQSLLGDPTFSLTYWNWDGPYTVGDGSSEDGACLLQGHNFPAVFSDPSNTTYDVNRSASAKGDGRFQFPDFDFSPVVPAVQQVNYNATEEELIEINLNVMYQSLVSGGTTAETFMGQPYYAGDPAGHPTPGAGPGTLEVQPHAPVHFWTGHDPPVVLDDMGQLAHSARDAVFFAHHGNIDRLFTVWKDIGPLLGQNREYYSDSDFLNATFLFYDENLDLRRVNVSDALDSKSLGYVYQAANDAAWIYYNTTRCSNLTYAELIAAAEELPVPVADKKGYYHLVAGTPFVIVIDRPDNPHGLEEFLTIDKIKFDKTTNVGFNVYVDLLNPGNYTFPSKCAEFNGRFGNMAQGGPSNKTVVWKQSVTRTFVDIQAPEAPSKVVITLIPLSQIDGWESIKFKSITIDQIASVSCLEKSNIVCKLSVD